MVYTVCYFLTAHLGTPFSLEPFSAMFTFESSMNVSNGAGASKSMLQLNYVRASDWTRSSGVIMVFMLELSRKLSI